MAKRAKKRKADTAMIGTWAFYAGAVIAVLLGLFPSVLGGASTLLLLGILGLIVGLLNIGDKELKLYLLANVAFLVGSAALLSVLTTLPAISGIFLAVVQNITAFVAPGAAIVGLKAIWQVSQMD